MDGKPNTIRLSEYKVDHNEICVLNIYDFFSDEKKKHE